MKIAAVISECEAKQNNYIRILERKATTKKMNIEQSSFRELFSGNVTVCILRTPNIQ
jgi:hypothetical protein